MNCRQILFVEDDSLLSLMACEFIRDRGIRVIEAGNADSAMNVIDKRCYISALVSDINLGPGIDGFEIARRARLAYPDLPVVFVSAAQSSRHAVEGVDGSVFISKPYHPRQITDALAALTAPLTAAPLAA
jgi:DNA-binding response OmpR family regulator